MNTKPQTPLTEANINYNIYNALNLYHEELGKQYLSGAFNPFENDYLLSEEFIVKRYQNVCKKPEVDSPDFISKGTKHTQKALEISSLNLNNCLLLIEEKLSDPTLDENLKSEYKKLKLYLACRLELTNLFISKLKKEKNTLKMYKDLLTLDLEIGKYFEESYNETFNIQMAIMAYIEFVKSNFKQTKKSLEDKKLIEKAKALLKDNLKIQEGETNKAQDKNNKIKLEQEQEKPKQTSKLAKKISVAENIKTTKEKKITKDTQDEMTM